MEQKCFFPSSLWLPANSHPMSSSSHHTTATKRSIGVPCISSETHEASQPHLFWLLPLPHKWPYKWGREHPSYPENMANFESLAHGQGFKLMISWSRSCCATCKSDLEFFQKHAVCYFPNTLWGSFLPSAVFGLEYNRFYTGNIVSHLVRSVK